MQHKSKNILRCLSFTFEPFLWYLSIMNITEISWQEAKKILETLNPKLGEAIDKISHTKKYPCYILEYEFGKIVGSPDIDFQYPKTKYGEIWDRYIPFSVVMDKKFEGYVEIGGKIHSYRIYDKGSVFKSAFFIKEYSAFELRDMMSISSGSRSAFLLPKASNATGYNRMQEKLNSGIHQPQTHDEHFFSFKDIATARKSTWTAKLLCFSYEWTNLTKEKQPVEFINILKQFNMNFDSYLRSSPYYDIGLAYMKNLLEDDYLSTLEIAVIKQLYGVICGQFPCYSLVTDDTFLPYYEIASSYQKDYEIETIPYAMEPSYLQHNGIPKYYSLSKNDLSYKPKRITNALKSSLEIEKLFNVFNNYIKKQNLYKSTELRKCIETVKISVFNDKKSNIKGVMNTRGDLFRFDKRFEYVARKLDMPLESYNTRAPFFTGCFGFKLP